MSVLPVEAEHRGSRRTATDGGVWMASDLSAVMLDSTEQAVAEEDGETCQTGPTVPLFVHRQHR